MLYCMLYCVCSIVYMLFVLKLCSPYCGIMNIYEQRFSRGKAYLGLNILYIYVNIHNVKS